MLVEFTALQARPMVRTDLVSPADNVKANAVVTAAQLPVYFELGWQLEVVCTEAPFRKNRVWCGGWTIRIVSPDGETIKEYSPSDGQLETSIKTANGLLSHLAVFDPPAAPVPWKVGEVYHVEPSGVGRRRAPKRQSSEES